MPLTPESWTATDYTTVRSSGGFCGGGTEKSGTDAMPSPRRLIQQACAEAAERVRASPLATMTPGLVRVASGEDFIDYIATRTTRPVDTPWGPPNRYPNDLLRMVVKYLEVRRRQPLVCNDAFYNELATFATTVSAHMQQSALGHETAHRRLRDAVVQLQMWLKAEPPRRRRR